MDFKVYQNRLSQLSARLNLMMLLVLSLLTANLFLSGLVWIIWRHHPVEITPFSGHSGYANSQTQVDSRYLSLMAENFIYSRLNVTPETVSANHQRLLQFADSQHYAEFLKTLTHEAKVIVAKKMSSTFDITHIQVNPQNLTVKITGTLKRYVGLQALDEERMTYQLFFRYHLGHLSILRFLKENNHA